MIVTKRKGPPAPPVIAPAHFQMGFVEGAVVLLTCGSLLSDTGPTAVSEVPL